MLFSSVGSETEKMLRLVWLLHAIAATVDYRWMVTVTNCEQLAAADAEWNSTTCTDNNHDYLELKIIDTESNGDIVCINKDIYPTITFTCEETYARIIVLALQKDTESWLAPIPSECESGNVNPLRYDIDPVQIGDTVIPQTTDSLATSIAHSLTTSTASGYTVGAVSTGWSAIKTWANSDLIGLARTDSGVIKQIVGLITNDNFVNVAPLFDITVPDLTAVESSYVTNVVLHTYTDDNGNMSIILGHEDTAWQYWECDNQCILNQDTWNDWSARTDLTGFVFFKDEQAFMIEGREVSNSSLHNSTHIYSQTVTALSTDTRRHYPSKVVSSRHHVIDFDTDYRIHTLTFNGTTFTGEEKVSLSEFGCAGIASDAMIAKSPTADAFAFIDTDKTCLVQAYTSSNVNESTTSFVEQSSTSFMGSLISHPGVDVKYAQIDDNLRLTLIEFDSGSGSLSTHRTSFNELLLENGPTLQARLSESVTVGHEIAHFDIEEDSINIVFYYEDSGDIKITNEKTYAVDILDNADCIHLNLMSTGEQLNDGEWGAFNVDYYNEFLINPPKKNITVVNETEEETLIDDLTRFNQADFITYAEHVDNQTIDYTAANTDLKRTMPSTVFLSNNEQLVIEARIHGKTGQEESIADVDLLYTLHEGVEGTTIVTKTSDILHRGTDKIIKLMIKPQVYTKAKPSSVTSKTLVSLRVSSPVCIQNFQTEPKSKNLVPSEAVSEVLIGCPPNKQLYFDKQATLAKQNTSSTQSVNCVADAKELDDVSDANSLPMCVKFVSSFVPNLVIQDPFMKTSVPFSDNYTLQVQNGDWLEYDTKSGEYLVPNFEPAEICQNLKPKAGIKYKCLGPKFKDKTDEDIKYINQQSSKSDNLKAIWESSQIWKPITEPENYQESWSFKAILANEPSNQGIQWTCKKDSVCQRVYIPPLAFHGLRTMWFGFQNMFKKDLTDQDVLYKKFHAPEFFVYVKITNDLENIFKDFNIPEQEIQNNCILETYITLRIGYVTLDPIAHLIITASAFCTLMTGFIVYVLLQQHELAVEKCKDQIYDFFDGTGNAERALYDAEYERKMTLINDQRVQRESSNYSRTSQFRNTSVLNNHGIQSSAHEMAKRISLANKRSSQVQPQQQPGAFILNQHNAAMQRRLSAVQGANKEDIFKRGSITVKKT